jgi:hypothetical protein
MGICLASCPEGFHLNGPRALMCDATGYWNTTTYPYCKSMLASKITIENKKYQIFPFLG